MTGRFPLLGVWDARGVCVGFVSVVGFNGSTAGRVRGIVRRIHSLA